MRAVLLAERERVRFVQYKNARFPAHGRRSYAEPALQPMLQTVRSNHRGRVRVLPRTSWEHNRMTPDPIPQAAREIAERHVEHESGCWAGRLPCICHRGKLVESLAREIAEYGERCRGGGGMNECYTPMPLHQEDAS
jgi:hypothetical protein